MSVLSDEEYVVVLVLFVDGEVWLSFVLLFVFGVSVCIV